MMKLCDDPMAVAQTIVDQWDPDVAEAIGRKFRGLIASSRHRA